jgi:predicted nucleotidyltransferase
VPPSPENIHVTSDFLQILNQLHDHHVEFVIVGGVAAALHGGSRVTFDLDVVPRMSPTSWAAAVDLLWSLGARPRIPEPLDRIRDLTYVRVWQREKGMLALNFRTPDGRVEVDLLVSESERFDELRAGAVRVTLGQRTFFVAAIDDLIAMKQKAGRPQDLLDIAQLKDIQQRQRSR